MKVDNFIELQIYFQQQQILERFGINRIGVFGSFLKGKHYNDIDLMIDEEIDYQKLIELREVLRHDLRIKVDIMLKEFAEPIIYYRAMKDMKYVEKY